MIHQTEGYLFCSYKDEISILLWKSSWTIILLHNDRQRKADQDKKLETAKETPSLRKLHLLEAMAWTE